MMHSRLTIAICFVALIAGAVAYEDECSQYPTCRTCLDIPPGEATGGRANCGWCHFNIEYAAGGVGKRCADIRDQPWRCLDEYDTYKCGIGWSCDFTKGQCVMAAEGEGFGNKTTCEQHCFPVATTYKCNTTSYKCEECTQGEPNCLSKDEACKNCVKPPTPPPTPPPHPPPAVDHFYCDNVTLTCKNGTSGGSGLAQCASTCSNSTPPSLIGVWRGLEAQKGFVVGEFDWEFSGQEVTLKLPSGDEYKGTVSQQPGEITIKCTSGACAGHTYKVTDVTLNNGKETETHAFLISAPDAATAPASLADSLSGADGVRVHIVSRCMSWKAKCDFTPAFDQLVQLRGVIKPNIMVEAVQARMLQTGDGCNQYLTCSSCIGARVGGVKCGWCMGGTLVYNKTGDSGMHCGGFQDGKPFAFTCSPEFRTTDCRGYECNWKNPAQPKCELKDGASGTEEACEVDCKAAEMVKCNYTSKQCEPCTGTDCNTKAHCEAVCAVEHAKCNYTTKQCEPCDPSKDPTCTQTKGACDQGCSQHTYGVCDPNTGTCSSCDPTKGTPGCVNGCSDTCSKHPPHEGNYGCDWSKPDQPVCKAGMGSSSQDDCMKNCKASPYAKCDTLTGQCKTCNNTQDPTCLYTKDFCDATCSMRAKCNTTSGKCEPCDASKDKGCTESKTFCDAACHKAPLLSGEYRAIAIHKGFKVAEWDFTFKTDNTVVFGVNGQDKYTADIVPSQVTPSEGMGFELQLKTVPANAPLGGKVGDSLVGLYTTSAGSLQVTKYFYLALGLPNADAAQSFDDGMVKIEFVLVACKQDGQFNCDFSSVRAN